MDFKTLAAVPAEFKFVDGKDGPTLEGYGAYFNNVDAGGDLIKPGAFAEFLSARGVDAPPMPMLYEHDSARIAGKWTHLAEDGQGLFMRGKFLDTTLGRESAIEVKDRVKSGLSIGFTTLSSTPRVTAADPRRTINKIHLWETSLVTFPMNDKARVLDVKSMAPSEFERLVREALNLSNREAKAFMAEGFPALKRLRDVGDDEGEMADLLRRNINQLKGVAK